MQRPPLQLVEQQSELREQESPSVLQALVPEGAGIAWQVVEQSPVQHWAAVVQALVVEVQAVSEQRPPTQLTEQHSLELTQAAPGVLQKVVLVQVPPFVVAVGLLQEPEQHSPFPVQTPVFLQAETGVAQSFVVGLQYLLQQSASAVQLKPSTLQAGAVAQTLLESQ